MCCSSCSVHLLLVDYFALDVNLKEYNSFLMLLCDASSDVAALDPLLCDADFEFPEARDRIRLAKAA